MATGAAGTYGVHRSVCAGGGDDSFAPALEARSACRGRAAESGGAHRHWQPRGHPPARCVCGGAFVLFLLRGRKTTGLWAATYFVNVRGIEPSVAAGWGSLFFFGIMGGRMISGLLAMRVKEKTLVRWGIGIAALGAVVLALPLPRAFQLAGLLLYGLGCAPIFPNDSYHAPALRDREFAGGHRPADGGGVRWQYAHASARRLGRPEAGFALLPYYLVACLLALSVGIFVLQQENRVRSSGVIASNCQSERSNKSACIFQARGS